MLPKTILVELLLITVILLNIAESQKNWWKNAVIYQVYPSSFKDSDNDGKGDLRGVIDKLDHFSESGISAIWFSPIYPSPGVDAGYDISDYRDINPEYGTLEDFKELLEKAHERGIKVILDLVPNHSSDKHEWFQKSLKNEQPYRDYYVWKDADKYGNPPNNWDSYFGGSTWTWSPERNQFYFHQFHAKQPDLDYRNPKVVEEMKAVITYWLDFGVDGFRIDIIPALFERSDYPKEDQWVHRSDQPETYDMVYQWRELIDEYNEKYDSHTRIIMTESYSQPEKLFPYYGNATHNGAHFTFNFWFITDVHVNSDAHFIKGIIDKWYNNMRKGDTANWVLGNHDQHRVASRFGTRRVDGLAMLTMMLPGVTVTYNGEEIGMENGEVTYKEGQDPQGCNAQEIGYRSRTRDFERTPFHWDNTVNAGFNKGARTWLPVSKKYHVNNLELQKGQEKSHYSIYKQMVALKKTPTIKDGSYYAKALNGNVLGLVRKLEGHPTYILLVNLFNRDENLDLKQLDDSLPDTLTVKIPSGLSHKSKGLLVNTKHIVLNHFEALVLTTESL